MRLPWINRLWQSLRSSGWQSVLVLQERGVTLTGQPSTEECLLQLFQGRNVLRFAQTGNVDKEYPLPLVSYPLCVFAPRNASST